jgi:hypothetical protein
MRWPSKGELSSWCMRGSAITFSQPWSRTAFDGDSTQP